MRETVEQSSRYMRNVAESTDKLLEAVHATNKRLDRVVTVLGTVVHAVEAVEKELRFSRPSQPTVSYLVGSQSSVPTPPAPISVDTRTTPSFVKREPPLKRPFEREEFGQKCLACGLGHATIECRVRKAEEISLVLLRGNRCGRCGYFMSRHGKEACMKVSCSACGGSHPTYSCTQ